MARTNRSGPLRHIVGYERSEMWGILHEYLECGHRGRINPSEESVKSMIERGQRRRCPQCKPNKPTSIEEPKP